MVLLTLPDTPVSSARGLTHLMVVAIVLVSVFVCATVLVIHGDEIPSFFEATGILGVGYLFGVQNVPTKDKELTP